MTDKQRIGTIIGGRYEVRRLLGEGGFSAVYEAVHTVTGREVALKLLHAHLVTTEQIAQRFLMEARSMAKIRHDGIVQVLDAGEDPDRTIFIALELLAGESLESTLLRVGKLTWGETVSIGVDVLGALAEAHRHQIIHRDIKPGNIFIVRKPDGSSHAKLLDFGIAHVAQAKSKLTQAGMILGTPEYMSPEQGRNSNVGPEADLWSVGIVLWECLAGYTPFVSESATEILLKVATSDAPIVSEVVPSVPLPVAMAIQKALAREVTERFHSADEMSEALQGARRAIDEAGARTAPLLQKLGPPTRPSSASTRALDSSSESMTASRSGGRPPPLASSLGRPMAPGIRVESSPEAQPMTSPLARVLERNEGTVGGPPRSQVRPTSEGEKPVNTGVHNAPGSSPLGFDARESYTGSGRSRPGSQPLAFEGREPTGGGRPRLSTPAPPTLDEFATPFPSRPSSPGISAIQSSRPSSPSVPNVSRALGSNPGVTPSGTTSNTTPSPLPPPSTGDPASRLDSAVFESGQRPRSELAFSAQESLSLSGKGSLPRPPTTTPTFKPPPPAPSPLPKKVLALAGAALVLFVGGMYGLLAPTEPVVPPPRRNPNPPIVPRVEDASAATEDAPPAAPELVQFRAVYDIGLPPGVSGTDNLVEFARHAATTSLFGTTGRMIATCIPEREDDGAEVYLYRLGQGSIFLHTRARVACEGFDLGLVEDVTHDGTDDVIAVDGRHDRLLVLDSRGLGTHRSIEVDGVRGVAVGGSFRTPDGPVTVLYAEPNGLQGPTEVVAVRVDSRDTLWRMRGSRALERVGQPVELGLAVGPDANSDGVWDVVVGMGPGPLAAGVLSEALAERAVRDARAGRERRRSRRRGGGHRSARGGRGPRGDALGRGRFGAAAMERAER
jgi:serine/threonine-protein kinase